MAVLSREEYIKAINNRIGDAVDDDAIKFLEDMTDTFDNAVASSGEDWKKKYEENDNEWRRKYRDRFMNSNVQSESEETMEVAGETEAVTEESETSFDDIFDWE